MHACVRIVPVSSPPHVCCQFTDRREGLLDGMGSCKHVPAIAVRARPAFCYTSVFQQTSSRSQSCSMCLLGQLPLQAPSSCCIPSLPLPCINPPCILWLLFFELLCNLRAAVVCMSRTMTGGCEKSRTRRTRHRCRLIRPGRGNVRRPGWQPRQKPRRQLMQSSAPGQHHALLSSHRCFGSSKLMHRQAHPLRKGHHSPMLAWHVRPAACCTAISHYRDLKARLMLFQYSLPFEHMPPQSHTVC